MAHDVKQCMYASKSTTILLVVAKSGNSAVSDIALFTFGTFW
jgi:hypothetical protein